MDERLRQISECQDINKKYNLTIGYMEDEGITFRKASDDHKNHHYRILEDGSSIFVYSGYFKLNLSEMDKQKLENEIDVEMKVLYKNKTQGIVDRVRPWTCSFPDVETLEKSVKIIAGRHMASGSGINVPVKPLGYDEENKVICPKCEYHFVNAERCPECGQKIDYSDTSVSLVNDESYRERYRERFQKYLDIVTTQERAEKGKPPLKSTGTMASDVFTMEDIDTSHEFLYWLESEEHLEEARNILIEEFTKRERKNPESDANQYIRDMRYFKRFYDSEVLNK